MVLAYQAEPPLLITLTPEAKTIRYLFQACGCYIKYNKYIPKGWLGRQIVEKFLEKYNSCRLRKGIQAICEVAA